MNTTDKIMELVAYYGGWREARGKAHAASVAAEKEIRKEIEALVRDAERWRKFLATRPAETHAVINEAIDAAMQEKQS